MHETGDPGRETLNAGTDLLFLSLSRRPQRDAFQQVVPYQGRPGQGCQAEPVRQPSSAPVTSLSSLLFADSCILYSPIPQWFRLKSDSKIQYNGT